MQWLNGAYGRCRAQDLSLHTLSGFATRCFVPGSAISLAWSVEFSGQVITRFQGRVSDGKAT